jgi:hypothetical protein
MIICNITNEKTILFLFEKDVPRRSFIWLICNIVQIFTVFGKIIRGWFSGQNKNAIIYK